MKVTREQYTALESAILDWLGQQGRTLAQHEAHYIINSIGRDPRMRARWDALYSVPAVVRTPIIDDLYAAGCDDSHIDTALRRVFA